MRSVTGRALVGLIAVLTFGAAGAARAIEFVVRELVVSEGGVVVGNHVAIPVGGTVTIGGRVIDPSAQRVFGLGAAYHGFSPNILAFVAGETVPSLFHNSCSPVFGPGGGLSNQVASPLSQTQVGLGGSSPGRPRIRVLQAIGLTSRAAHPDDPGLDGSCGAGDSQFRVTFSGIADGETTITIGTGDDQGGVFVPGTSGATAQAINASVTVTVPEPGIGGSLGVLSLLLALAARSPQISRSPMRAKTASIVPPRNASTRGFGRSASTFS